MSTMLVRVLIFLILLSTNLTASEFYNNSTKEVLCDEKIIFNPKIDTIEIKISKNRKWLENLFKLIIEFNSPNTKTNDENVFNFSIKDSYKKYYKARVNVNYRKINLICKFKAKVKITGDGWWHINWIAGKPLASLQVKLIDGNINNIVNFKLLLPKSRGEDNEIFIVSFLRYLNFIAPKTFYTNAIINGNKGRYIFQEDLNKELLESYSLVEGPIIEGDERFTIEKKFGGESFSPLSLSRISNYKYVKNDLAKINKSFEAITLMNRIYIQSHLSSPHNTERLNINSKMQRDPIFINNFDTYESLMYAMNANHGLSHDDRRFYYDPINNYLLPIYYDGKPKIVDFKETEESLTYLENVISLSAQKGALNAIHLINDINDKDMIKILDVNGFKINKTQYLLLKKKLINRLNRINTLKPSKVKFYPLNNYFNKFTDYNDIIRLVFSDENELEICNISLLDCKKENISYENISNLFAQKFNFLKKNSKKNLIYLFIGKNKNYYNNIQTNNFLKKRINKNFIIKYNKDIKLGINYEAQILDIYQQNSYGRAIIYGKEIRDWQVNFFGSKKKKEKLAIKNYQSLNGCITFVDIKLIEANLFAKDSKCEDAINLVRTKGNINKIEISNSLYDGLDIDFSSLSINEISVDNSMNDCVDLSFGNYEINTSKLINCGDKGISIGEKSYALLNSIKVLNVNTGIASKDSSVVKVNNSNINNTKICLSAFRKKQEFGSASISIKNLICNNYDKKINIDRNSVIDIKN